MNTPLAADPERTWAVLVGIEEYESRAFAPLRGAAADAFGHAKWLCAQGVPPEQIQLCVSPYDSTTIQAAADELGLRVRSATREELEKLLTREVRRWRGDLLWLAWNGHGVTLPGSGELLLPFSDGVERFEQALSADRLQEMLLSEPYQGVRSKIVFIDACRTREWDAEGYGVVSLPVPPKASRDVTVSVVYATQDNDTAGNGRFGFTHALLDHLHTSSPCPLPPNVDELTRAVQKRLEAARLTQKISLHTRNWRGDRTSYEAADTASGPREPRHDQVQRRDDAIEILLRAQREDSARQPYRISDDQPLRLDEVYVPLLFEALPNPEDLGAPVTPRLPVEKMLASGGHVLIESDAGTGKTTFAQHVSGRLASAWLDGESQAGNLAGLGAVPIRVHARYLTGQHPLALLLQESVRGKLGYSVSKNLPPNLFEHRPRKDTTWLVLVDGLDEIDDPEARKRVIDQIAGDIKRGESPYRWVVATRPLSAEETEILHQPRIKRYKLVLFDDEKLRELARSWLARGVDDRRKADEIARRFLRRVDQSGLRQIIRTPLLATLALAIFRQRDQLPNGRPGLYRTFMQYMLNGRDGELARYTALQRVGADVDFTGEAAQWLYDNREAMLEFLARRTDTDETPTLDTALSWVRENVPEALGPRADYWRSIVPSLLTGSGLLSHNGLTGELIWIHRSFAEYLAARHAAGELPSRWPGGTPELDPFLRRSLATESQDQTVLTIACWAESNPQAANALLEYLVEQSAAFPRLLKYHGGGIFLGDDGTTIDRHIFLAGRLLAEGVKAPEGMANKILDRLGERARSVFNARYYCPLIGTQPQRSRALETLLNLTKDTNQQLTVRVDALVALGENYGARSSAVEAAVQPMLTGTETANFYQRKENGHSSVTVSDARAVAAYRISTLGDSAHDLVMQFLDRLELAPEDGYGRQLAAEAAIAIGENGLAVSLIRTVSGDRRNLAGEIFVLLRAGKEEDAKVVAEHLFETYQREDFWAEARFGDTVQEIVNVFINAEEKALAREFATKAVSITQREHGAIVRTALALAGDSKPGMKYLADNPINRIDREAFRGWAELARTLWAEGCTREVERALEPVLTLTHYTEYEWLYVARLLRDIKDGRYQQLLLKLARDTTCYARLPAAEELLLSDPQLGISTLVAMSKEKQRDARHAVDLARCLVAASARGDAVRLLSQVIKDFKGDEWSAHSLSDARDLLRDLKDPLRGM
ncbi:caspase family protein [Streptomyces collinus]|uniref:Putative nacht domain-containing signal transduction protein n=1 Tax=Streptomyces collinus (strain DSM 40733 / Tue 365) TaxID=1214242 RepID=S5VQZ9_STRC3|nr:caspase family protein [Streptomyces collinus]AGS70820.1 putative nacht domain-containing signal transduction protein [Streptomyces collinus Tu 365]UJA09470.1 nacht domain-containing signal transduction protein [Streptomyces collinus]UJA15666.1 nacht domain-containing signal transduction protein [Streptomyces collinus]